MFLMLSLCAGMSVCACHSPTGLGNVTQLSKTFVRGLTKVKALTHFYSQTREEKKVFLEAEYLVLLVQTKLNKIMTLIKTAIS